MRAELRIAFRELDSRRALCEGFHGRGGRAEAIGRHERLGALNSIRRSTIIVVMRSSFTSSAAADRFERRRQPLLDRTGGSKRLRGRYVLGALAIDHLSASRLKFHCASDHPSTDFRNVSPVPGDASRAFS